MVCSPSSKIISADKEVTRNSSGLSNFENCCVVIGSPESAFLSTSYLNYYCNVLLILLVLHYKMEFV